MSNTSNRFETDDSEARAAFKQHITEILEAHKRALQQGRKDPLYLLSYKSENAFRDYMDHRPGRFILRHVEYEQIVDRMASEIVAAGGEVQRTLLYHDAYQQWLGRRRHAPGMAMKFAYESLYLNWRVSSEDSPVSYKDIMQPIFTAEDILNATQLTDAELVEGMKVMKSKWLKELAPPWERENIAEYRSKIVGVEGLLKKYHSGALRLTFPQSNKPEILAPTYADMHDLLTKATTRKIKDSIRTAIVIKARA